MKPCFIFCHKNVFLSSIVVVIIDVHLCLFVCLLLLLCVTFVRIQILGFFNFFSHSFLIVPHSLRCHFLCHPFHIILLTLLLRCFSSCCCSCIILFALPYFVMLFFLHYSSHVGSSYAIALYKLLFSQLPLFALLFFTSCCSFALLFLRCCCSSFVAVRFVLFFSHNSSSHVIFLTLQLLCCSSRIVILTSLLLRCSFHMTPLTQWLLHYSFRTIVPTLLLSNCSAMCVILLPQ